MMMRRAFDELGYRRYAWQCNSLNARSRAAATRLGFTFEGIWRQANVHKGRNRDTAWFSILDSEWPVIKAAFQRWLAPENFDAEGRQRMRLQVLICDTTMTLRTPIRSTQGRKCRVSSILGFPVFGTRSLGSADPTRDASMASCAQPCAAERFRNAIGQRGLRRLSCGQFFFTSVS